jgi:hypothetical protein
MHKPDKLDEIRARWRAGSHIERWRELPTKERFRAIAEIEETLTAVRQAEPDLAASLTAALDVLEACVNPEAIGSWKQSHEDMGWLLREIERLRAEAANR